MQSIGKAEIDQLTHFLKKFERADSRTLDLALQVIRKHSKSSSEFPLRLSGLGAQNPFILDLFRKMFPFSQESHLSWVHEQGYESIQQLVEKKLESCVWNNIQSQVILDPTYDVLSKFIFGKKTPQKVPAIGSFEEDFFLEDSFLQRELGEQKETELSIEEEFHFFSIRIQQRFKHLLQENISSNEQEQQKIGRVQQLLHALEEKTRFLPPDSTFLKQIQMGLGSFFSQEEIPVDRMIKFLKNCLLSKPTSSLSLLPRLNKEKCENFLQFSIWEEKFQQLWEQREKKNKELQYMQSEFLKLKNRIETYPETELFAQNPEQRKTQYYRFGVRLAFAFVGLLEKKSENLLFLQIKDFLETCFKGWDEQTLQLMAIGSQEPVYLSPQLEAWRVSCLLRRTIMEKALLKTWEECANNVHYQNAARWTMNQPFQLGFSREELGSAEPLICNLISTSLRQQAVLFLQADQLITELIEQLIHIYKEISSPEEKQGVFSQTLDQYLQLVQQDSSFLIDSMEEIQPLFERLKDETNLEELKKIIQSLKMKGIFPPFSLALDCEKIFHQIQAKQPRFFQKAQQNIPLHTAIEHKITALISYFQTLSLEKKQALQDSINNLLKAKSAAYIENELEKLRNKIASYANSFIEVRALYNRSLLEKKLNEETWFGAYLWAVQAKILKIHPSKKGTIPIKILQWVQSLPFSLEQEQEICRNLHKSISQMQEGTTKNLLLTHLEQTGLQSFLDREQLCTHFSSLLEVACFGNEQLIRNFLGEHGIHELDIPPFLEISLKRGFLEIVHDVLSRHYISEAYRDDAFLNAVKYGNLEIIQTILSYGNITESSRNEGIFIAVDEGKKQILKELLSMGYIDKEVISSVLSHAVFLGDAEMTETLLENFDYFADATILHAAFLGDEIIVETLLNSNISLLDKAVIGASHGGHLEIVQKSLARGEISEENRYYAIFSAGFYANLEVMEELLKTHEYFREHAILGLAQGGHLELLKKELLKYEMLRTAAIRGAIWGGQVEIFRELYKDDSSAALDPIQIIQVAVQSGHMAILLELVQMFGIKEEDRYDLIQQAILYSRADITEYLLESREDLRSNAIECAIFFNNPYMLKKILEHNEELMIRAIEQVVNSENIYMLQSLLEDHEDLAGYTLIYAAKNDNLKIFENLLDTHKYINSEDIEKARKEAVGEYREKMIQLIDQYLLYA